MRCALVPISNAAFEGLLPVAGFESAGFDRCAISFFSLADLAENPNLVSSRSRWAVDVGIAQAISKPGVFARRHLQASQAAISPAETRGR
jgi:hypothetical protein